MTATAAASTPRRAGGAASRAKWGPGSGTKGQSRRDTEHPTGGWSRDANGNLKAPTQAAEPVNDTPTAPKTPEPAGGFLDGLKDGAAQGKKMPRPHPTGPRVGPVRAPGTPAGVLLAVILYPAILAGVLHGPAGVRAWFDAKFLNKTTTSTSSGVVTSAAVTTDPAAGPAWLAPSSAIAASVATATGATTSTGGSPVLAAAYTAGGDAYPSSTAAAALAYALAQVGKPYVWGASGPGSFDCSGLTSAAYAAAGHRIARTASLQLATAGARVSGPLAPGDLLFPVIAPPLGSHVAMYAGGGRMVEAANPSVGVRVTTAYRAGNYIAKRVA